MIKRTAKYMRISTLWSAIILLLGLAFWIQAAQSSVGPAQSKLKFDLDPIDNSLKPAASNTYSLKSKNIPGTVQVLNKYSNTEEPAKAGEVLIQIADGQLPSVIGILARQYNCEVLQVWSRYGQALLAIKDGTSVQAKVQELGSRSELAIVSPNWLGTWAVVPNDPFYNRQYHLAQIQCPKAWDLSKGSPQVVVGIIDSGLSIQHPDLQGNVWLNQGEIPGNGIDDDGNGYADDVNGYDFGDSDSDINPDPGVYGEEHGTHVSGIAAAVGDNGLGVCGVSWNSKILMAKVGSLAWGGAPTLSATLSGLTYCADNGARVVNLSLGFTYTTLFNKILADLHERDVVIVCAEGNDGMDTGWIPSSPVCNDGPLGENWATGVAATDQEDIVAYFSSYGKKFTDICAPGWYIYSTIPYDPTSGSSIFYSYMSGTSMASPVVAGAVSVIQAYRPLMGNSEIQQRIKVYADNIDMLNPFYAGKLGGGRLNLYKVLQNIDEPLPPLPGEAPEFHRYPLTDLIAPSSEPIPVLGLDLFYVSGMARLKDMTVRFKSHPNSSGRFTQEDLASFTNDTLSGLAVYKDRGGTSIGSFDWNAPGSGGVSDQQVPISNFETTPSEDGTSFSVKITFDLNPEQDKDAAYIPSATDNGLFDFFVVIRSGALLAHNDAFTVDVPARSIHALDQSISGEPDLYFYEQDFPTPDKLKIIYGDIVKFVNFTQPPHLLEMPDWWPEPEKQPITQLSPPTAVLGINASGHKIHEYAINQIVLDVSGIKNFSPDMFNPLSRDQSSSGIALYRDQDGTNDGIFDGPGQEALVPLQNIQWEQVAGATDENKWRVVLTPQDPQPVPEDDTSRGNAGSDYFIVVRTSDKCRDGQTFRLEVGQDGSWMPGNNWRPMAGHVGIDSGDQKNLQSRRVLTNYSELLYGSRIYDIKARPKPAFSFHDVITNTRVGIESRSAGAIGIDLQDFGANVGLMADEEHWGWTLRNISFDVVSANPDFPVKPEYFRPMVDNRLQDNVFGDYASGFGMYWDDDTPTGDKFDDDELFREGANLFYYAYTLRDEELLDNRDNDEDGFIDEDVGDGDPEGINGRFDSEDDYIPFSDRNFTFPGYNEAISTYVTAPKIEDLTGEPGFRVTFSMILRRNCELHDCVTFIYGDGNLTETCSLLEDPLGAGYFFRFAEWPEVNGSMTHCEGGCGNCNSAGTIGFAELTGIGEYIQCIQPPKCPDTNCSTRRSSYDHYVEIPDDNNGVLYGDDMYIAFRTNSVVPNGLKFYFRVNSGASTYAKFSWVTNENLYPGSSEGFLETKPVEVVVDAYNTMLDLTRENQRIYQFSTSSTMPVPVIGLNMDVWESASSSPEAYATEFSYETIHQMVLDFKDEGGFQLSVDPTKSDLLSLGGTVSPDLNDGGKLKEFNGVGVYFDNGTNPGKLDPQDTPVELVRATADDLVKTPTGYRLTIRPKSQMRVPYDDREVNTPALKYSNQGVDYFITLRPSANMSFNDKFRVRLATSDMTGSATVKPQAEEFVQTNILSAGVPAQLLDLTQDDPTIPEADQSPNKPVVGINVWDGRDDLVGQPVQPANEEIKNLVVAFVPESPGFTSADLASLTTDEKSGVAIYKDVDDPNNPSSINGEFDPFDQLVPLSAAPRLGEGGIQGVVGAFKVELLPVAREMDVPDSDKADNLGADYFIVIRTSKSISGTDRFSVYLSSENSLTFISGPGNQGIRTGILRPIINEVPSIQILEPSGWTSPDDNYNLRITWADSDPDNDAIISLFYGETNNYVGTLIKDNISEDDTANAYIWDVRGVPTGTYNVFGVIRDGPEQRDPTRYPETRSGSSGMVKITNYPPMLLFLSPNASTTGEYPDSFEIRWEAKDPENDASIDLYYTSQRGLPGKLLAKGLSENYSNVYTWHLNQVPSGEYYLYAIISDGVNPPVGPTYSDGTVKVRHVTKELPNFPIRTGDLVFSSPVLADLNGDSILECAVGADDSKLYVFDGRGAFLPNYPLDLGAKIQSAPAVGDVVGSVSPEVVTVAIDGQVYVTDGQGRFASRYGVLSSSRVAFDSVQGNVVTSPSLYDFNADGKLDIVIADGSGHVVVLLSDGTKRTISVGTTQLNSSPAIGDVNSDGDPEIVLGVGRTITAVTLDGARVPGFPLDAGSTVTGSPALGDLDASPGLEIVFGTQDKALYAVSGNGAILPNFPKILSSSLLASPIIIYFQVNDTSDRYLVAATTDGTVSVVNAQGQTSSSRRLAGHIYVSPAAADLNADGTQELIVANDLGEVFALCKDLTDAHSPGSAPSPFARVNYEITSSPAIGDIDNSDAPNVIFADAAKRIHAWDLVGAGFGTAAKAWPMFRSDAVHSGRLATVASGPIFGDLNGDGVIDSRDLFIMSEYWHVQNTSHTTAPQDLNENHILDDGDLYLFVELWHSSSR